MFKKNTENQIAFMKRLIQFGNVNENKANNETPIVEYKKLAANGKTYGIVRECSKYYIMEAPAKDTEVLAEDFAYIGGINNRKANEFNSYTKASAALDLKLMSINESVEKSKRVVISEPVQKAEWEDGITESMRNEIERFKTITTNAKRILKEEKGDIIPSAHTLPEAPAKNPSDDKVNAPFVESGVAEGEKDFKETEENPQNAGTPFEKDAKVSDKDMESDKKKTGNSGDVYKENPKYVDTGVAGEHPSGGKVVRVSESKGKKVKLTLEQVLAWNDNKDYMDKSTETHIGSSAPFTDEVGEESNQKESPVEPIHEAEGTVVHNTDNENKPAPGTNEVGDSDPFNIEINEDELPFPDVEEGSYVNDMLDNWDDIAGMPTDDEAAKARDAFEKDYDNDVDAENEYELVLNDDDLDDEPEELPDPDEEEVVLDDELDNELDNEPTFEEGKKVKGNKVNETVLDDFGKTPGYRKVPMTTPPNKEVAKNGAHEWDDESAQGEEPFGKSKGDSAPYDILVDAITKKVYEALYGKKKS